MSVADSEKALELRKGSWARKKGDPDPAKLLRVFLPEILK